MTSKIEGTWDGLMRQAFYTAQFWYGEAWASLKERTDITPAGRDDLAVRMAQVAGADFVATAISVAGDKISDAINALADAIESHSKE